MLIDLNCDLGEGGGFDAELLKFATSANICCGAHAGDEATIRETLRLAKAAGVEVGAHPGYDDRANFGRRNLPVGSVDILSVVTRQIEQLAVWAAAEHVAVQYLKPHGALYNQACSDERIARPIVQVAERYRLAVLALPDSWLEAACQGRVPFIREGFADRRYRDDGTLVPRGEANALITDVFEAVAQAKSLASQRQVRSICIHGDHPRAVKFARELRRELEASGAMLRPFVDAST